MRLTEFWRRMERRFGPAYADSLARDHVLSDLGGHTVHEALAVGTNPKLVWLAVCEAFAVPRPDR
jgi:hypothetical protein